MKVFLCLALCAVAAVSALPIEENVDGWYVPQNDGSLQWMTIAEGEALLENTFIKEGRLSTNPVTFYLYTKANPLKPQEIKTTKASVDASNFNSKNPTRFVIHGWGQSSDDNMNKEITKAWLSRGDFNVIIVDWARARSLEYASSVMAVGGAGDKVGEMIKFLNSNFGMSLSTLFVIGHSLGAHVSGYAGKNVGAGKIGTIVALDPALPLFNYDKPSTRLNSGDAVYVESIQTNGGKLGFLRPIGKASFYPNGGQGQPGCGLDATGACAHGRSITYYAEAVTKNDFPTMKCSDYDAAVKKNCGATYSSVKMGATNNPSAKINGDYYVPVNSKAPFGMAG